MGRVVAIVNRKGGVGKTTTTVAIADILISEFRKNVCVVDLDPQASASIALAGPPTIEKRARDKKDLSACLNSVIESAGAPLSDYVIGNVNIIRRSAGCALAVLNNSDTFWEFEAQCIAAGLKLQMQEALKSVISQLAAAYDYVLVDCPPGESASSAAALASSDLIACPTCADRLSFWGLGKLRDYLERLDKGSIQRSRVIITRYEERLVEHRSVYDELDRVSPIDVLRLESPGSSGRRRLAAIPESAGIVKRMGVTAPRTLSQLYPGALSGKLADITRALVKELQNVGPR